LDINKLNEIEAKYDELTGQLADPQVLADHHKYQELARAHSELSKLVEKIRDFKQVSIDIEEAKEMLKEEKDSEMELFLHNEQHRLEKKRDQVEEELKEMLIEKDPNDEKSIIMEIRAGTGGEEASLFAADLFRMYSKFAEAHGWATQVLSSSPSDMGGFKEIIFEVNGRGAYSLLKYESGVHRVQRVPVTESSGRIHTSASTVAVLPEAEDVEVEMKPNDLRIDIFRSSGPGGQSVNTTDSAVRITHLPTGMVVSCQEERSQFQNRDRALKILRARLYEHMQQEQQEELAEARRLQVGTGDRSERIRTYNFPQGRVTDHRIGLTLHNLNSVLEGDLQDVIEALVTADRAKKLEQAG
jgi:peptide chain release factor 1